MSDYANKRSSAAHKDEVVGAKPGPAPGKRTLAEQLREAGASAPVQRSASRSVTVGETPEGPRPTLQEQFGSHLQWRTVGGDAGEPDTAAVHAIAERGIATTGGPLPHLDPIQRAFGRHDVSGIQTHTGREATASAQAIGAEAYATGNHVVLGGGIDLHTVAHEAAHVVQQRGGVQLKGGVGEEADAYEQHADQVADAVVQGNSAEDLLNTILGAGPQRPQSTGMIQRVKGLVKSQRVVVKDQYGNIVGYGTIMGRVGLPGCETEYTVQLEHAEEPFPVDEGLVAPQLQALQLGAYGAPPQPEHLSQLQGFQPGTYGAPQEPEHMPQLQGFQPGAYGAPQQPEHAPKSEVGLPGLEEPPRFRTPTRNNKNLRKRPIEKSLESDGEKSDVKKTPAEPERKKLYSEPEDSSFLKWIKDNHSDMVDAASAVDVSAANEAVADHDGARAMMHILNSTGDRLFRVRAIGYLHGKGVSYADLRTLTRGDTLAAYLKLDDALAHIQQFGGAAVAHYGKQALDAFQCGRNGVGEHFFKKAELHEGNGELGGGHLRAKWDLHESQLRNVKQQWTDTIEGFAITQYEYRNSRGDRKLKTVFASTAAGDAIVNKALVEGITALQAETSGRWSYRATLASGHRVTVEFNGADLVHIT